jgi:hypothetical protein
MTEQATMPDQFIKWTVGEMKIGMVGWVPQQAIWVDEHQKVWLSREADLAPTGTQTTPFKVTRTRDGYAVELGRVLTLERWTRTTCQQINFRAVQVTEIKLPEVNSENGELRTNG